MTRELLELQRGIIYGPVNSRRLGSSLGLNLLPAGYKVCPFNCAYCQYGYTDNRGYLAESDGSDLPSVDQIIDALTDALEEFPSVSYITFSGNGEATLHPDFTIIVDEIKTLKSKMAPHARLAILSNSALVHKAGVRQALARLDDRFMKLDAGDEDTFRRYNRPHRRITFESIVNGLKRMDEIVIQALFAGGKHGNYTDNAVNAWIEKIAEIKPLECHIYSIDRPFPDGKLEKTEHSQLDLIKERAEKRTGIPIRVF